MKHSAMNRRLLLEWLHDCHDAGEPMPTDCEIMSRFRFDREELARTLIADLADARSIVVTGAGRDRVISMPGAVQAVAPPALDPDRFPATVKRSDPDVDRVTAMIANINRSAGRGASVEPATTSRVPRASKEPPMPKQPTPPQIVQDMLRDAGGSFDLMIVKLLERLSAAEAASGQRAEDAETIAVLTKRAEEAEGKLATLKALFS